MAIPKPRERRGARQQKTTAPSRSAALERVLPQLDPHGYTPATIRMLVESLAGSPSALVSTPSQITRRALAVIDPAVLYLLLGIDVFAAGEDAYVQMEANRSAALAGHHSENEREHSAAEYLEAAWRQLPPQARTDEIAASAMQAHWRAELASLRSIAARVGRTPKATIATSRERAIILEQRLQPQGWTRGTLADLIIASETDWAPPPIELQPALRNRDALISRLNNLINARSNRRR